MSETERNDRDENSAPQAKRTGRESDRAREIPQEFVDDLHTNREDDADEKDEG